MNRSILTCVLVAISCGLLCAQQNPQQTDQQSPQPASPSDPYSGVAHPPSDDTIVVTQTPQAKPAAGKPLMQPAPAQTAPAQTMPWQTQQPAQASQQAAPSGEPMAQPNPDATGTDNGTVQVAPAQPAADPALNARDAADPDGDMVHPHPMGPGTLEEGTTIRVHLLTALSTEHSQRGDEFRSSVASDVIQDGQVLIPTGAEIDGRVVDVSHGTAGGHGMIRLRPDWVVLQNGSKYRLDAQVTGTPGSNTRVGREGTIEAGSRYKRDGLEYGGGVGAGVVTGAVLGGPVGALAGGLIGAGAITAHLVMDHPQATLAPGTVLVFSLNERLNLQAPGMTGN
ncbi:MAG TPA: hypothetical protein VG267_15670 [Terracidiphilus sp.]|jgi:hypothetical protein|nr:hypothetical protein [Terracidiphilus sp.]